MGLPLVEKTFFPAGPKVVFYAELQQVCPKRYAKIALFPCGRRTRTRNGCLCHPHAKIKFRKKNHKRTPSSAARSKRHPSPTAGSAAMLRCCRSPPARSKRGSRRRLLRAQGAAAMLHRRPSPPAVDRAPPPVMRRRADRPPPEDPFWLQPRWLRTRRPFQEAKRWDAPNSPSSHYYFPA